MAGFTIPEISLTQNPPVGFHFAVVFLIGGKVPNPIDMRFKKVSGISSQVETEACKQGGDPESSNQKSPKGILRQNLTLERGLVIGSPLNIELNLVMSGIWQGPGSVLVALLNDEDIPISAWLFKGTHPVKWSISDLDADTNSIVIETIELSYKSVQVMRI